MRKLTKIALTAGLLATAAASFAVDINKAEFVDDGQVVMRPAEDVYRNWVYVGTPLTPNALNGGAAPFPEFHNVYIEQSALEHFKAHGDFAEGTQIAKELVTVRTGDNCDAENGSCGEVSGQGYFMGEFAGLELLVKDSARFPDQPGGWTFFSFGHTSPAEYAATAEAFPAEACNACHEANAETDFVFTQFYPVLRAYAPK